MLSCDMLKQRTKDFTRHARRREHSPVPKRPNGERDEAGLGKRKRSSGDKADRDAREDPASRKGRTFTRWD